MPRRPSLELGGEPDMFAAVPPPPIPAELPEPAPSRETDELSAGAQSALAAAGVVREENTPDQVETPEERERRLLALDGLAACVRCLLFAPTCQPKTPDEGRRALEVIMLAHCPESAARLAAVPPDDDLPRILSAAAESFARANFIDARALRENDPETLEVDAEYEGLISRGHRPAICAGQAAYVECRWIERERAAGDD